MRYRAWLFSVMLLLSLTAQAQRFFNLTSDEVSVDSVLPTFTYTIPLQGGFRDSVYTASILYPEFIDMTEADITNYHRLSNDSLQPLPLVNLSVIVNRGKGSLRTSFCPLVYRDGKYQILVSFMLRIDASGAPLKNKAESKKNRLENSNHNPQPSTLNPQLSTLNPQPSRYASHSVLASGTWAKIRVPSTGVYELTADLARRAGFSDLSKVHIYGYGGNLQDEVLDGDELSETDDLHEVPTCTVNGHRLFYARGPVSWSDNTATRRTRNPYSDYGYYFITSDEETPESADSATFINSFYPSADDYHSLYEVDGYSWYPGGRNLYDTEAVSLGQSKRVVFSPPSGATNARLSVNISAGVATTAEVSVNGNVLGTLSVTIGSEDEGNESYSASSPDNGVYQLDNLSASDTVSITVLSGGPMRLDYVSAAWDKPFPAPELTGSFSSPEYVYNITNQDHHADAQADMVIIIPTSQKLLSQAQRLASFHEQHDSLRVNIVPADELYNEFSSGTPNANAYRRYMKMLYDRAETDSDMPKYLLLFGGCVWDNRMLTSECRGLDADDYLLCYESENSFNKIQCYVDDGFFTYLDDGEGTNIRSDRKLDMSDVAVGRFPVTTEADAKTMVDKTIGYVENGNAGVWQNVIMLMGDDGNNNIHMQDADNAAEDIDARYPGYDIKKVMWDAYNEVSTSTGNTYPAVSDIIKRQQQQGALIMDYVGHGSADLVSHEKVLTLNDFKSFTNKNLPLWITASCDIMAFDGLEETIGESAVTNSNGGAVAFFGTTRTVYVTYNRPINMAYLKYVLSSVDGKPTTIGEAQRLAKNEMITTGQDATCNKLQYSLLGDPAIALNQPSGRIVIDSIDGQSVASSEAKLRAGHVVLIVGHVVDGNDFNGVVTVQVLDSRQLVTCHMNQSAEADTAFTFYNRDKTVYSGSDSVRNGLFDVSFTVPYDLNYDDGKGLVCAFATNGVLSAHGSTKNIVLGSSDDVRTDSIGPKIYCYLNSPDFTNGGDVNIAPYFVAQLSDDSGINATGNGVGHDLELVIDGDASLTYNLNDNFSYDFGSYTSGSTYYSIPALEPGKHSLTFQAWDVMNNMSRATLSFNVVKSLEPRLYSVDVTNNPASTTTTFIVSHNFGGSSVDITIDVFDMSGRELWRHSESGTQTGGTYTVNWDLTQDNGERLQTGVYLYRVRLASDGSASASKAKKLIVINNN